MQIFTFVEMIQKNMSQVIIVLGVSPLATFSSSPFFTFLAHRIHRDFWPLRATPKWKTLLCHSLCLFFLSFLSSSFSWVEFKLFRL